MKKILFVYATNRKKLTFEVKENKSPDNALYGENYMQQHGYDTDIAYVSPIAEKLLDIIFSPLHKLFRSQIDIDFKLGRSLLLLPIINKYDAIIANTDGINLALCFLKKLNFIKVPLIYAVGLFYIQGGVEKSFKYNNKNLFLIFYKWIIQAAEHIIYHAPIEKEKLLKLGLYNPAKCTFIAMGSDQQFFSNYSKIQEERNLIVSIGKDRARDYKTLIEACKKLPNHKFVIICQKENLKEINIPSNVQIFFNIPYSEVANWYYKASVIVIPIREMYRSSGQMTLTDAIQVSKPIIISNVVGISHYDLQNGKDLIKVKPESVKELVNAIKKLSGNKTLKKRFKNRTKLLAKIYNTKNYAKQVAKVVRITMNPCKFTPISKDDLNFLRSGRNESRNFFINNRLVSEKDQASWFRQYLKQENDYMFLLKRGKLRIGAGSIYNINYKRKVAEIGRFFIKSEFQNRGYGKILLTGIEEIAICELGLKKLSLCVILTNKKAINLYKRSGFKLEETKKIKNRQFLIMTKSTKII